MKLVTLIDGNGNNQVAYLEDSDLFLLHFDGDMLELIQAGTQTLYDQVQQAKQQEALPLDQVRLIAPILSPSKIVAIGKNYAEHAKETKSEIPEEPIVFAKFSTTIIGPDAEIQWDQNLTNKVDFEAELAVIIGRKARLVSEEEALDYVFGYTCANDVSARDLQYRGKQWIRGKSLDTFCPLGPWIITADEVPDPQSLDIRCQVNDKMMQESNTRNMIFSVAYLISFLSAHFTLLPGDIILTGTPEGVGNARVPPELLGDGDVVTVEIDTIGKLINHCRVTTA
ncbi:MAG: fumarylacetoacetate hydrolase family protein [Anaerolineae bacterium]|nr:fumarylacetoacetate hydrolase family protein [Anaerolineae bacterium]